MQSRTTEAYREVFSRIKEELPGLTIPAYMGDYDKAMRGAFAAEFPTARIYGCWFHYSQALTKYASRSSVGLAKAIKIRGPIRRRFLPFTSLALLPPGDIPTMFERLAQRAIQVDERFVPFVNYIRSFWLGDIGATGTSVYRAPCRTNNGVESHNATLLRRTEKHGKLWNLIGELQSIAYIYPRSPFKRRFFQNLHIRFTEQRWKSEFQHLYWKSTETSCKTIAASTRGPAISVRGRNWTRS